MDRIRKVARSVWGAVGHVSLAADVATWIWRGVVLAGSAVVVVGVATTAWLTAVGALAITLVAAVGAFWSHRRRRVVPEDVDEARPQTSALVEADSTQTMSVAPPPAESVEPVRGPPRAFTEYGPRKTEDRASADQETAATFREALLEVGLDRAEATRVSERMATKGEAKKLLGEWLEWADTVAVESRQVPSRPNRLNVMGHYKLTLADDSTYIQMKPFLSEETNKVVGGPHLPVMPPSEDEVRRLLRRDIYRISKNLGVDSL